MCFPFTARHPGTGSFVEIPTAQESRVRTQEGGLVETVIQRRNFQEHPSAVAFTG